MFGHRLASIHRRGMPFSAASPPQVEAVGAGGAKRMSELGEPTSLAGLGDVDLNDVRHVFDAVGEFVLKPVSLHSAVRAGHAHRSQ